jgi:hypothetical protein
LRPAMEPCDLVTPGEFADAIGEPRPRVRKWIQHAERIIGRRIEPVGYLGTYPRYDWNDLAALEREMRRRRLARTAA